MAQSLSDRYFALIDQIVDKTLQGKIASTERVYIMLQREIEPGTGEIWERCFTERIEATQAQLETKLKAGRILRALETIETQYNRLQKANQLQNAIASATQQLLNSGEDRRIATLNQILDINQKQPLNRDKLQQLAQSLQSAANNTTNAQLAQDCQQIATGILTGLTSFSQLEDDLISWMYQSGRNIGFEREKPNPWELWRKKIDSPLPKQLFQILAEQRAIADLKVITNNIELKSWVELAVLLQYLQQGLVSWYDKQPYNTQFGKQLSYSTLLTFAAIWLELSQTFTINNQLREGCFQITLQILRLFARRDDFPLYNGIFVSFSGEYLQNTLQYLSQPIQQIPGDIEKARILTLLGYSQRTLGQYQQAIQFHEEALEIARKVQDKSCQIANLNHLSRTSVQQKDYDTAINYSQRALILARQTGNRQGETNALVNLGYSKVFSARGLDTMNTDIYNEAIRYLEQGLQLAEKAEDIQSQSLGNNSLGIAYVILEQPVSAISALEKGAKLAQIAQNIYLQGLSYIYLAEAYYSLEDRSKIVYYGCLGMYLLHQINSLEWRKSAGLMTIIKGQIGEAAFSNLLSQYRSEIIALIGVDGYDYIPQLLEEYQNN
ncbi:MAG: tetratricopeptide repeat protein [Xenococcaceae cyanobacterium MO_207.B15]|nr:tetratricopeptide repeat protein [Xenococcaceae cyanobacterium MO_207.B15]MDJ0747503.1 tetratricopeptide repeat protein [Xenococcaceae cyanobacterium MO_167.B27]